MTTSRRKLGLGTKLAYGVGQMSVGFKNSAFETFLFFYYNQVLGLSGTLAGAATLIALCVDAVTDPVVGSMSDRWRSTIGRRHPFMYAGALPLAVTFYLAFAPPAGLDQTGLFLWLVIFAVLARTCVSVVFVPLMALGAELTEVPADRMSLVAYRYAFGFLAHTILILVGFGLFFAATPQFPDGQLDPAAYPGFALTIAITILLVVLLSAAGTQGEIPNLPPLRIEQVERRFGLRCCWADLRRALANRSFRAVTFSYTTFSTMRGVQLTLGLHILTYFWQFTPHQIELSMLSGIFGIILGLPLARIVAARVEKRVIMGLGIFWFVFVGMLPVVLRLVGLFPENGDPWTLRLVILCNLLAGLGGGGVVVANGSMLADVADEHELEYKARQEGIFFGAAAFAHKSASGFGHLIAGIAIDLIRFPADAVVSEVHPEVLVRLGIVYGPASLLLAALAVMFLTDYYLSSDRHEHILRSLATARQTT